MPTYQYKNEETGEKEEWVYQGGPNEYLIEELKGHECIPSDPFEGKNITNNEEVEWSLTWPLEGEDGIQEVMDEDRLSDNSDTAAAQKIVINQKKNFLCKNLFE